MLYSDVSGAEKQGRVDVGGHRADYAQTIALKAANLC